MEGLRRAYICTVRKKSVNIFIRKRGKGRYRKLTGCGPLGSCAQDVAVEVW